jgi:hypothetical protein
MTPDAFFDLTYNATDGRPHHVLHEDYYYPPALLMVLAARHGFEAEPLDAWSGNAQAKLRLRLR